MKQFNLELLQQYEEESETVNVTRTWDSEETWHENIFITYDNEGKEKTLSIYEKEENLSECQEETVKACDGYISIYEYRKISATQYTNVRT